MSGTSLDGVDAVLAEFSGARPVVIAAAYSAFTPELRAALQALQAPGPDELHRAAMAANALVDVYAATVAEVLAQAAVKPAAVTAIGAHGQTVRHRPADGYTWQINNPARLAEATGITVVADFRSRDVAAGGQGAPLVPAFHAALFQQPQRHRAVVNIGGIANITNLPAGSDGIGVTGWDTGPGNVLLDVWCERHQGTPFDDDGRWAAQGNVDGGLSKRMRAEPYFAAQPPKSTGRDLFNAGWLESKLEPSLRSLQASPAIVPLSPKCSSAGAVRATAHCCGGSPNVWPPTSASSPRRPCSRPTTMACARIWSRRWRSRGSRARHCTTPRGICPQLPELAAGGSWAPFIRPDRQVVDFPAVKI